MNPSELTEKSVYLRRLADQLDNLALEQIALDNRRAGLMGDFSSLTYPTTAAPIARPEMARPPVLRMGTSQKSKGFIRADNPNCRAIMRVMKLRGCGADRDNIMREIKGTPGVNIDHVGSLSFYLSSLKHHGLIDNPEHGYWVITEKGLAA